MSDVSDAARQSEELTRLIDQLAERGISSVPGGREVYRLQLPVKGKAQLGRNMQELASLAQGIRTAAGELIRKKDQSDAVVDGF